MAQKRKRVAVRRLPQMDELHLGIGDWAPRPESVAELRSRLLAEKICGTQSLEVAVEVVSKAAAEFLAVERDLQSVESREAVKTWLTDLQLSLATMLAEQAKVRAAMNWLDFENAARPPKRAMAMLQNVDSSFFPTSGDLANPAEQALLAKFGALAEETSWVQVRSAMALIEAWATPRQVWVSEALAEFSRPGRDREAYHRLAKICRVDWKWLKEKHHARGSLERYAEVVLHFIERNGGQPPEIESFQKLMRRD